MMRAVVFDDQTRPGAAGSLVGSGLGGDALQAGGFARLDVVVAVLVGERAARHPYPRLRLADAGFEKRRTSASVTSMWID